VWLNEKGKNEIARNDSLVASILSRGDVLLLADLRGYGESIDPLQWNESKYATKEYRNAMISLHAGIPLPGQRVTDILTILDFVSNDSQLQHHSLDIHANGTYGPAALHAAVLDRRIANVRLEHSIKSYTEFLTDPLQQEMYTNVLYGVLRYYDLPDLIDKIDAERAERH
jgi:hypothetical protein